MDDRGNWHETPEDVAALQAAAIRASDKIADESGAEHRSKVMLYLDIGEIVEIRGEQFRVRKITKKDIVLRSVRLP
jgi:hypothetical protein